jgi:septation ring formation regulator EzrA
VSAVVIAIVAVVIVLIVVVLLRRSRRPDGVAQFQRQINALSPEARRPVVDKVQQLEEEPDEPADGKDADGA